MDAIWCFGIIAVLIVVVVLGRGLKEKEMDEAKGKYQASLRQLTAAPGDPNLKQTTLALGRSYSNLTRNRKGVTIFDEMALMNDLNAATAGVYSKVSASSTPPSALSSSPTTAERLRKLDDLKIQGLINEQEYAERRTTILNDV